MIVAGFAGYVLLALAAAMVLFYRARVSRWAVVGYALLVGVGFLAVVDAMGIPKPSFAELRQATGRQIIAFHLVPERRIYLWVRFGELPRAYVLPWDRKMAEKLMQGARKGRRMRIAEREKGGKKGGLRRRGSNMFSWPIEEMPVEGEGVEKMPPPVR